MGDMRPLSQHAVFTYYDRRLRAKPNIEPIMPLQRQSCIHWYKYGEHLHHGVRSVGHINNISF
jgi:hypothetical protein